MQFYTSSDPLGISIANTVSAGPDPKNTLDCDARNFPFAMRHHTTAEAVNNLLSRLTPKLEAHFTLTTSSPGIPGSAPLHLPGLPNIVGHGDAGLIETGAGQGAPTAENMIALYWSSDVWRRELGHLAGKSFSILSLFSCDTGSEDAGADLLYDMARVIGKPVQARTGFTFCNGGIKFEANTVWQVATPQSRPNVIHHPPEPRPTHAFTEMTNLFVRLHEKVVSLDSKLVSKVIVTRKSLHPATWKEVVLEREDAIEFARICFGSEPFEIPGPPLARESAHISLLFQDSEERRLEFTVFNDRLIVDNHSLWARAPHSFRRLLAQF